ncbi:hypothetical protein RRG08_022647 [Elysia crispata]|uniref:Uncharacterized protein n=1 Tax=Elysia crispata TaxID=231223 RepID=A0AAE0Z3L3_9GAST|nr:hypothetical protein RRG08_022647 [Elysia crispata]
MRRTEIRMVGTQIASCITWAIETADPHKYISPYRLMEWTGFADIAASWPGIELLPLALQSLEVPHDHPDLS